MLRIDHLVVNIDKKYQTDKTVIQSVRNTGLPYEPKWGKGTKGFKASWKLISYDGNYPLLSTNN